MVPHRRLSPPIDPSHREILPDASAKFPTLPHKIPKTHRDRNGTIVAEATVQSTGPNETCGGTMMRANDRSGAAANSNGFVRAIPLRSAMLKITSAILLLAFAVVSATGMTLHSSEHGCHAPRIADHCDQMKSAPVATPFGLCCFIDQQEPGPTGASFSLRVPSFGGSLLDQVTPSVRLVPASSFSISKFTQAQIVRPPGTAPYLLNLTLLI
jgi:hypothetical protein